MSEGTRERPAAQAALFDPARHEPLEATAWDERRAREAIRAIVEDLEEHISAAGGWPSHPLDDEGAAPAEHKSLYLGAAGVLWAMAYLARAGAASLRIDPGPLLERTYERYLAGPDTGEVVPSYFLGEVGILLPLWRLTGSREAAERLAAAIERNIPHPANEPLWAAPGTMVGALHMLDWTGEDRWRDLFLANADHLWRLWKPSPHSPCHLWTQDLYGSIVQLLGAGHGFAGNAYPLLRGANLLPQDRRETLYERCAETLAATCLWDGARANWPPGVGPPRPGRSHMLVQWCHGAPGIVTSFAHFPPGRSATVDAMLVAAGETIWTAGPLEKGHGLCHGTAGNGYAFLALHQRTGDPLWLARAHAFAMHALGQMDDMRRRYRRGRYTLWTGDPGLAVYLWHCVKGAGGMPGLDGLD